METDANLINAARRLLDQAERDLDAGAVARLRAARQQAIEQGLRRSARARPAWLLPGLATAIGALTVGGWLWLSAPQTNPAPVSMDDLELLSAQENPEFFSDLDFYDWLDDTNAS
ncbi:MAG: hypothetical protein ACYC9J_12220 [Sulfuricaulis sp.]